MDNFTDRFKYLLKGRLPNRWGKSIGSNSGTITRMGKGTVPGTDIMQVIWRTENVSPSWFEFGLDAPFMVRSDDDEGLAEHLEIMLHDEPSWNLTIISDYAEFAVLLNQPAGVIAKNKAMINYQACELLGKGCDQHVLRVIQQARSSHACFILHLTNDDLNRFRSGYMGSYELFGDERQQGLIHQRKALVDSNMPMMEDIQENPQRAQLKKLIESIDDEHLPSLLAHGDAVAQLSKLKRVNS